MNDERSPRSGQVPLPGSRDTASVDGWGALPGSGRTAPGDPRQTRTEGLRRARRISNWTAAALIVGTGATAVALAHHAVPVTVPTSSAVSASGTTGTGATAVTNAAGGPRVSHSVATTSASGVTTTTTQLANGKTVVTHVGHASAYHDN